MTAETPANCIMLLDRLGALEQGGRQSVCEGEGGGRARAGKRLGVLKPEGT